jgi:hypothetical protein
VTGLRYKELDLLFPGFYLAAKGAVPLPADQLQVADIVAAAQEGYSDGGIAPVSLYQSDSKAAGAVLEALVKGFSPSATLKDNLVACQANLQAMEVDLRRARTAMAAAAQAISA